MSLFIMVNRNCFGKKAVQVGKRVAAASTEVLKIQDETFLKTFQISNYNLFFFIDFLPGLNWLTGRKSMCLPFV